jgi:hypothetical protein
MTLRGAQRFHGLSPDTRLPAALHEGAGNAMKCQKCGAALIAKPVPGAKQFPRRLECPEHGWQQEKPRAIRMRFHKDRPDW